MTLKAALANASNILAPLRVKAPDMREFTQATSKIIDDGGSLLTPISTEDIQHLIRNKFEKGALSSISRRELRSAPKGFFDGPAPLASDRTLFTSILSEIRDRQQRSAVIVAIFQYLEYYNEHHEEIDLLGRWLDQVAQNWDWPWKYRAEKHHLFSVRKAPTLLAEAVLNSALSADAVLEEIGLSTAAASGYLGEAAFRTACLNLKSIDPISAPESQTKLIAWSNRGGEFAFQRQFASFASALLTPWAHVEPTDEHRANITMVLEGYAGDPRTRPAKWGSLSDQYPEAYAILLRWLTKASVYQFFDIVDRTADQNMWKYRRAFWTSYLEAGHIEQAWVVFGANGQHLARQAAKKSDDRGLMSFGKLIRGSGKSPDHAALIMKIGDLTIAEWSHNGKYNIWGRRDKFAPKLFQSEYDSDELRGAPVEKSHIGADRYYWQSDIASTIKSATGLITPTNSWKPSRKSR